MKNLVILLLSVFTLAACEGPQGPPGYDGQDGGIFVASAFEIVVDFTPENDYQRIESYGFEVYPSDVVLAYIEWETFDGQPVWRPLPQLVEFDEGSLIYNFDFTQEDVGLFLDGSIDFGLLGPEWTDTQAFRVVVVPADNVDGIDTSDLNAVMEAFNIERFEMKTVDSTIK